MFEADRCIISKNNLFVGRTYLCNSLLKLSLNLNKDVICNVSHKLSNEKVDLHYLWHVRLGHVNFDKIAIMSKHDLITMCNKMSKNCKMCMLNKITRTPFKSVERKSEILELIHSDFCDIAYHHWEIRNMSYFLLMFSCLVMYIESLIPMEMGLSFVYM